LITPGIASSILEGITRRTILQLAADMGIPTVERDISRTELYAADEAFFCGTGAQVAWIESIDRRVINNGAIGPITDSLQKKFFSFASGNEPAYMHWLTPVYS
jgi:branched-chain amino acid aminotransferase